MHSTPNTRHLRQVSDFVVVTNKRIENSGLTTIEWMTSAIFSENNFTGYSHFAAVGMCSTTPPAATAPICAAQHEPKLGTWCR